ncbi:hypothetical protein BC792_12751 [Sphingobacterium allocomposti]|uniref:Uncharacterized protein n=1 Tax=Sphingobacterium allocomposti TaxID=415956 RepID=A0A5S5D096_9SPHI|nr:hypothetical protein BC792_12751 [Sphingobacterium composti Yoo et al. 2007 non Ten et al. 2007]
MTLIKYLKQIVCKHEWEVEHNYLYWWKRTCKKCSKVIES